MAIKYKPSALPAPKRLNFGISTFYGVNNTGNAQAGEFESCKNMGSDKFPFASPSAKKEVIFEGIDSPQRLLYCGNKLAYISGGNLFVEGYDKTKPAEDGTDTTSDEDVAKYGAAGSVGEVTSVVEFNNKTTLFYPSGVKFDFTDGGLSEIVKYAFLTPGYFEKGVANTASEPPQTTVYRGYGNGNDLNVFTYILHEDIDSPTDYLPGKKDENGKVNDYLRSVRTNFVNSMSELMGVPYSANNEALKPLFNAAWAEYKETGRVSQETVNNSIKKDLSRDKSFDYFKVLLYQSL